MFTRSTALAFALAASALLAGCGHGAAPTTIANGGIVVHGEQVMLNGSGGSEATLGAAGTLAIDGRAVPVDAAQRQWLQQYYQGALAVREHGLATGKAGAAVAVQSLKNAATHVIGGDGEQADASLDAATKRVDREASKICLDLQQISAAQEHLATSLAAFRPFARIMEGDQPSCSKDS